MRETEAAGDPEVPWGPAGRTVKGARPSLRLTVALAVSTSASWLMLDTSGELFMMTRMRDRGSDTSRCSPHLSLPTATSAIFPLPPNTAACASQRPAARWEL